MAKNLEVEIKVGLFVTIGTALIMLAIIALGSTQNFLSKQNRYYARFKNVEGLIQGAKVVLNGVSVGTVSDIALDNDRKDIVVELNVARQYGVWVHDDSTAEIATQGVLGDKYVLVASGSGTSPLLAVGAEIPSRASEGLTQFINKGDQLMINLNNIARNLDHVIKNFDDNNRSEIFFQGMAVSAKNMAKATEKINAQLEDIHFNRAMKNLDGILAKINNGTGTLGALINDPGLYDDAKSLMGGANRNRIVRNLVRQTIKKGDQVEAEAEKAAAEKK